MAKQLNVNLAFTADTKQAKTQLADLQNQLTNIMNFPAGAGKNLLAKDLEEASKAAAELKIHLQNATNIKTGTLDFAKLNQSIQKSGKTLNGYGNILKDLGPAGEQAFLTLTKSVMTSEIPIKRSNALLTELWTTLKNTARWQLSSSILHGFMGALQSAYYYAQDLNESLNKIQIVTGKDADQMATFAKEANKAAKALSTTTTQYTDASLIYYQQGLSDEEIKERTNVTIKMANVANESAQKVSNEMTAVWNNFDDGSKSLEYYADVITALGAATASSSSEIAQGLEKFAAISDTIGLSYEYATSALATVTAKTRQSADIVGTAFKTIFARIQGLKLGETLEDGVNLNKYSEALKVVGVDIFDQTGQLKDMNSILNDMGEKWGTLAKSQQVALAQTVAGVRQYNQLIALMDNWDTFQKNLITAQGSSGTLSAQAEIYEKSWKAASKRVQASLQGIYDELIDDTAFVKLLDSIDNIINYVDKFIKSLGGLNGILTTTGALLTKIFSDQLSQSLSNMIYNIKMSTSIGRESVKKEREKYIANAAGVINPDEYATSEGKTRVKSLEQQLTLQNDFIENSEKMSESEKQINQILLDRVDTLNDIAVKKASVVDKTQEQLGTSIINARGDIIASKRNEDPGILVTSEAVKELNSQFSLLQQRLKEGASINVKVTDFLQSMSTAKNKTEIFQSILNELESDAKNSDFSGIVQQLEQVDITADDAEDELTRILSILREIETKTVKDLLDKGVDDKTVKSLTEDTYNYVKALKEQKKATKEASDAGDAASKAIKNSNNNQQEWANTLVASANAALSVASAIRAVQGTLEVLNNEDLSGWEQLSTIFSSLLATAPMLISSLSSLAKIFNTSLGIVSLVVGTITALTVAIKSYYDVYKENNPTLEEATKNLKTYEDQLQKNQERLAEINGMPWTDLSGDILQEKAALEAENAELRKNIDLNKEARVKRAKEKLEKTQTDTKQTFAIKTAYGNATLKTYSDVKNENEAIERYLAESGMSAKDFDRSRVVVKNFEKIEKSVKEYNTILIDEGKKYLKQLTEQGKIEEEQIVGFQEFNATIAERVALIKIVQEEEGKIPPEDEQLLKFYEQYLSKVNKAELETKTLNTLFGLTQAQIDRLNEEYPELNAAIEENNGILSINVEKLFNVSEQSADTNQKLADMIATETIFNNRELNVSQKIQALMNLATAAHGVAETFTGLASLQTDIPFLERAGSGDYDAIRHLVGKYGTADPNAILKKAFGEIQYTASPKVPGLTTTPTKTQKSKKNAKNIREEIEQFHQIKKELEVLQRQYEKLGKAKDQTFGEEKLKYIEQEIEQIDKLQIKQNQYIKEMSSAVGVDQTTLKEKYGATFDENNLITNWESIMKRQLDIYNTAVNNFNSGKIDEKVFEQIEKKYEEFKKLITDYEALVQTLNDAIDRSEELEMERISKKLEELTYSIDFNIEIKDRDLKRLESITQELSKDLNSMVEIIDGLDQQTQVYLDQADMIGNGINEIRANAASENRGLTDEERKKIYAYEDSLGNIKKKLESIAKEVDESLLKEFQRLRKEIDDNISRFDIYNDMLDHYNNIIKLSGRQTKDSALLMELAAQKTKTATEKLDASRDKYLTYQKIQADAAKQLQDAESSGDSRNIEYWKKQYKEITNAVEQAHNDMLESWTDTLQAAADEFDQNVELTIQKLKDSITAYGLDTLADEYNKRKEENERYLSDLDKEYELNKLINQMEKSIDDTDNLNSKEKLNELLQKTYKIQKDGTKLTEYDLSLLQKKYELMLAEDALEAAKQSKTSMRLVRNDAGNWDYVYTANQEKINKATQDYEDKLYELKKLSKEHIDELSDLIIQNEQELAEALNSIDRNRFQTKTEYEAEVNRITEYYMERDKFLREELDKTVKESGHVYEETLLGQLENTGTFVEGHTELSNKVNETINSLIQHWTDWKSSTEDAMQAVGSSADSFTDDIRDDMQSIGEAVDDLSDEIDESTSRMEDYISNIMDSVRRWRDDFIEKINDMIRKYQEFLAIQDKAYSKPAPKVPENKPSSPIDKGGSTSQGGGEKGPGGKSERNPKNPDAHPQEKLYYYTITNPRYGTQKKSSKGYNSYELAMVEGRYRARDLFPMFSAEELVSVIRMKSGGYTGSWGPEGKLAMLHEKELVLNKEDTANMLTAVNAIRTIGPELFNQIKEILGHNVIGHNNLLNNISLTPVTQNAETGAVEQNVIINADFPGVTAAAEIEEALRNLGNDAAQYASIN